jgi:hypothetical protein
MAHRYSDVPLVNYASFLQLISASLAALIFAAASLIAAGAPERSLRSDLRTYRRVLIQYNANAVITNTLNAATIMSPFRLWFIGLCLFLSFHIRWQKTRKQIQLYFSIKLSVKLFRNFIECFRRLFSSSKMT